MPVGSPVVPNWNIEQLLGEKSRSFVELLERYREVLSQVEGNLPRKVLIQESDPISFLAWFLSAHLTETSVFLSPPQCTAQEKADILALFGSGWVTLSDQLYAVCSPSTEPEITTPWIMIPTGGSTGSVRFAIHTWDTLSASVFGFQTHCDLTSIDSYCVLPLHHVSGLMQFMRCLLTRGTLILDSWKALEQAQPLDWDPAGFCLSLVPTQLQRLVQIPSLIPWLRCFKLILLGGGPVWPELLEQSRLYRLPLAPTYGMTETASQAATLKPEDFLAGRSGSGRVLPHAQISIRDDQGRVLAVEEMGRIMVRARSLTLGYYPDLWAQPSFLTQDLGYLDVNGYLHVTGRADQVIITGGEKVVAFEVEVVLRSSGWFKEVCVIGVADPIWGQRVVALYVPDPPELAIEIMGSYLKERLSPHKIPKAWIPLPSLPRSPQGKVNRAQVFDIAMAHLEKL